MHEGIGSFHLHLSVRPLEILPSRSWQLEEFLSEGESPPEIIWKLKDRTFMKAFKDKGRLSHIVVHIPVKVIMNERTALLGAASRAMALLKT